MTITYAHVQSGTADTNPATVALTVTAGNLLVVHALERSGTTEANFTISDTAGNTWTKRVGDDIELADGSFRRTWVVWHAVANGSGSTTVSVDNGTANAIRIIFSEIQAGAAVTWSFEAAASNDNATTADATSIATGTTASVGAGALLLIGGFGLKKNSGSATAMNMSWASSNLTNFTSAPVPLLGNDRFIAVALLQESGAGTKASTATIDSDNGSNNGLAASILVFSATEGAGTITGTGAVTLGAVTVAGTAEREVTDVGGPIELTLPAITVSGTGTVSGAVTGSGAIALGAVTVSGTAEREIAGTGAIILGRITVAGTAERTVTGTGAITLGVLAVAGTAQLGGEVSGTGAIALGAVTVSGTAERELHASGAITLAALTVAGAGTRATDATGAISLGALRVSAQGLLTITGAGAITLGAIVVSGFDAGPSTPTSGQSATLRGPSALTVRGPSSTKVNG